jgi:F5/8 type C domain
MTPFVASARAAKEFVFLRSAIAKAEALPRDVREHALRTYTAGEVRLRIAETHASPQYAGVALDLYRQAISLFRETIDLTSSGAALPMLTEDEQRVLDLPLQFDALDQNPCAEDLDVARSVALRLHNAIDLRSERALKATRLGRWLAAGVLLLWALSPPVKRALHGPNIARGALASSSSQYPGTPSPAGLTNGTIESTFAMHTQKEANPWARVDLTSVRAVREIRVVPRGDGYLNELIPLTVEVSSDGETFAPVQTRTTTFTQRDPWVVPTNVDARFIRVRMITSSGYIALAEIEAYAK